VELAVASSNPHDELVRLIRTVELELQRARCKSIVLILRFCESSPQAVAAQHPNL
jgi:hypothetical protein